VIPGAILVEKFQFGHRHDVRWLYSHRLKIQAEDRIVQFSSFLPTPVAQAVNASGVLLFYNEMVFYAGWQVTRRNLVPVVLPVATGD